MKIAVTGSNGLLGQHLVQLLISQSYQVIAIGKGPDRTDFAAQLNYKYYDLDIADQFLLQDALMMERPDVLVHGAAITQIDECELNQSTCKRVNEDGTLYAMAAAELYCSHFIFVSTDFVFDGEQGNYAEDDTPKPVSFYGNTKLKAESLVRRCNIDWAIVRTCLVYGNTISGTRSNIITWVKKSLEDGKSIKVVSDQVRTPTYVGDLARGVALIIENRATGVYHISGKDVLTPYDMALATASYFGLPVNNIEKVDASVFSQPARRPLKTGFNISKARRELGYEPISFEEGLKKMFE